jgi:hypothetical protein
MIKEKVRYIAKDKDFYIFLANGVYFKIPKNETTYLKTTYISKQEVEELILEIDKEYGKSLVLLKESEIKRVKKDYGLD